MESLDRRVPPWHILHVIDEPVLFTDISELVQPLPDEGPTSTPLEVTRNTAMLVEGGRIIAVGSAATFETPDRVVSLRGRAVVPGLVDSHTHVVFAGDRIEDFARRCRGETYAQIAAAGGGILSSAAALRASSPEELVAAAEERLLAMLRRGTTTCEIKSGYGLEPELELMQLRAVARLRRRVPQHLVATALAHVVPLAAREDRGGYIERFCNEVLAPAAEAGLAQYVDIFVEESAFTPDEARAIAARAVELGLAIKLHVDQLHDGAGARLAAELGALSADHLEYSSQKGLTELAAGGSLATLLPGCTLYLGKGPWPPGRAARAAGCEVAVATDCNPGSSMILDLPLCATLAATQCGLTLEEALWAITRGGAKALGLYDRGCLRPGERADFVVVDHRDWRALLYQPGSPPVAQVFIDGQPII